MIPTIASNPKFASVVISTGNILNVNNKLGRKSNEELIDGLKLTLQCGSETANHVELNESAGQVLRATQELNSKLTENERPELSIGAKIFLNKKSSACIEQALNSVLEILKVEHVDNVVLAYHPPAAANGPANNATENNSVPVKDCDCDGGGGNTAVHLKELQQLWQSLEQFALQKQITQLGVSDLDMQTLSQLHKVARVPPTIAQINLASCCVVPPELQEFCNKHDIQLLTHSDPEVLLHDEQFIIPGYTVDWTLRYQVHVRCRGVLTAKGYILGASKLAGGEKAAQPAAV